MYISTRRGNTVLLSTRSYTCALMPCVSFPCCPPAPQTPPPSGTPPSPPAAPPTPPSPCPCPPAAIASAAGRCPGARCHSRRVQPRPSTPSAGDAHCSTCIIHPCLPVSQLTAAYQSRPHSTGVAENTHLATRHPWHVSIGASSPRT